jgi:hypothetical protein
LPDAIEATRLAAFVSLIIASPPFADASKFNPRGRERKIRGFGA